MIVNQVFLPIAPESSLFWAVGLLSPPAFAMGIDQVHLYTQILIQYIFAVSKISDSNTRF